jgi:H+/Cl- antiporter ClcA
MRSDPRHQQQLIPNHRDQQYSLVTGLVRHGIGLVVVGVVIGLACWPLNMLDRIQSALFAYLPTRGGGWTTQGLVIASLPVVVMPVLLLLQRGGWKAGAGSGIPSTMNALEDPSLMAEAMAAQGTVQRGLLWSIATAAMFPLGREGPVVQVGAAVARALHPRLSRWLPSLSERQMVAIGGGAGLAGGFNTPLLGAVFMLEELTTDYAITTIWPALVVAVAAAGFSNLGGEPLFGLGIINVMSPELEQILMAVPIGIAGGVVGGLFSQSLVWATARLKPLVQAFPVRTGLVLGGGLTVMALATWGTSAGDGESLLQQLITEGMPMSGTNAGELQLGLTSLWITVARVLGPMLALAPGVPGGLIDPALTFGGLLGYTICAVMGLSQHLGIALGLAAGLSGATQLPLVSIVFAWRLTGDQQLFAGLILAAVVAAYVGRLIARQPVYHALSSLQSAPRR